MGYKEISKKLIEHDARLGAIEEKMATKDNMNQILNSLDAIAKNTDKIGKEVTIINTRTERMENWIIKAAEKNRVPYDP